MREKRRERVSSLLRSEIANIIQRDLRDPRIGFVSVMSVHPTEDLKEAEVRVSLMGSEAEQRTTLRGLIAARGFIQTHLADRVRLRNTPALRFVQDESIRKGIEMDDLIRKVRSEGAQEEEEVDGEEARGEPADTDSRSKDSTEE
ncbi:MAG: 30S ribosome-binding factor RbfA [Planctomycetota bacterium]